jgi:lysophospholipase L1-like esterase
MPLDQLDIPQRSSADTTEGLAGKDLIKVTAKVKEIVQAINELLEDAGLPSLATVATSGQYADLLGLPSIPAAYTNQDAVEANAEAILQALAGLSLVAKTGQYADLADKPTIPDAYTDQQALAANAQAITTATDGVVTTLRGSVPTAGNTLAKLYASIQTLIAIVGGSAPDADAFVNTVTELLAIFATYPEGVDLVQALAGKVGVNDTRLSDARTPLAHKHLYADITDAPVVLALAQSLAATHFVAWGDSLTDGLGLFPYPQQLSALIGFPVLSKGVGSETSTQIRTRFDAAPTLQPLPTIFWVGRNNASAPATVLADIAAMVAKASNYLVLSVLNASNEPKGSAAYNNIISLNQQLATAYGDRYLDVRALLISKASTSTADVADVTNDVVPTSLRKSGDPIHLNATGYGFVAAAVAAKLPLLLNEASQRLLTAQTALELFRNAALRGPVSVVGDSADAAALPLLNIASPNGNRLFVTPAGDAIGTNAAMYINAGTSLNLQAAGTTIAQIFSNALYMKKPFIDAAFQNEVLLQTVSAAPAASGLGGKLYFRAGLLYVMLPGGTERQIAFV